MLVHRRFPELTSVPQLEAAGRPLRTVIGDALKRFWRATKPPARVGAGAGAIVLQHLLRTVLWVNLNVAAVAAIISLWLLGNLRTIVPLTVLAVLVLVAKIVWNVILLPFHHVALAIVGAGAVLEGLLAGRVFVQLAYEDNPNGLAGSVLQLTGPIVAPFRELEGTPLLHDTGVVEFATLTAMEAVLVLTIGGVLVLMFWSEFLHMYRNVAAFFTERAERRRQGYAEPEPGQDAVEAPAATAADLGAAS